MRVLMSSSTSLFLENIIQVISHITTNLWFLIFLTLFFVAPSNIYAKDIQVRDAAENVWTLVEDTLFNMLPETQYHINNVNIYKWSITFLQIYLSKYGYLPSKYSNPKTADLITEEAFSNALMDFQDFSNLNKTGVLDNDTIKVMKTPRCGVPDKVYGEDNRRHKRYTYMIQGVRTIWNNTYLTYYFSNYSVNIGPNMSIINVEEDIQTSFQYWSNVTPLTFSKTTSRNADIIIFWAQWQHGDTLPFDGPYGTLAHAYSPGSGIGGDVHFDDSETWTRLEDRGQNLVQVATHEFGHALGLGHSTVKTAVMAPTYERYNENFTLDPDDIAGIQSLYGRRNRQQQHRPTTRAHFTRTGYVIPRTTASYSLQTWTQMQASTNWNLNTVQIPVSPSINTLPVNSLCYLYYAMDTMFTDSSSSTYVFMGHWFWKLTNQGIVKGYPKYIINTWPQAPTFMNAALNYCGLTYFFKDNKVWCYSGIKKLVTGYPKLISQVFPGIPDRIDAAFVWHNHLYFFKGTSYWAFGKTYIKHSKLRTAVATPKQISLWVGIPLNITAAFQDSNKNYFVVKSSQYYRLNDQGYVDTLSRSPYPRDFKAWWLDCPYYPMRYYNYL